MNFKVCPQTIRAYARVSDGLVIFSEKRGTALDRMKLIAQLLHACTRTSAAATSFLENPRKYAANDSLYMREVHFVVALGSMDKPTMGEMAEALNITPGAVTQMVTRLEKKGYVTRAKAFPDKRQTTLSLTEKGKTLCSEHIAFDREEHRAVSELLHEFSDQELVKIIHYEQIMQELFTNKK